VLLFESIQSSSHLQAGSQPQKRSLSMAHKHTPAHERLFFPPWDAIVIFFCTNIIDSNVSKRAACLNWQTFPVTICLFKCTFRGTTACHWGSTLKAGVSKPAPGASLSCRVQPQSNTPKPADQDLPRHIRNFQAGVWRQVGANSSRQWPSRTDFGHPCLKGSTSSTPKRCIFVP